MGDDESAANQGTVAHDSFSVDPFPIRTAEAVHALYTDLRAHHPVCPVQEKPMVLVTRFDDLSEVLRDVSLYSSCPHGAAANLVAVGFKSTDPRVAEIYETGHPVADTLVRCDPPTHSRQRRVVSRFFTPRRVQADWSPVIQRHTSQLFDAIPLDEPFDVMDRFAVPLPIRVIAELLGAAPNRTTDFKQWSDAYVASLGRHLSAEQEVEKATAHVEMQGYFMSELQLRRESPAADLLGELAAAATAETLEEADQEGSITLFEAVDIAEQLLVAGNETTTQALGESALLLGKYPEQLDLARDDLTIRANLVEELLRLSSPILGLFRYSTAEHTRRGTAIARNEVVAALYGSANRDDSVFEQPDELRAERPNARNHLAFGNGIHFCVGAPLARAEMRAFVDGLVERQLRIEVASDSRGSEDGTFLIRGRRHEHIRLRPI